MYQLSADTSSVSELPSSVSDTLLSLLENSTQALDSLHAAVTRLAAAGGGKSLWDVGSSLATIVVAVLAIVELGRLYQHHRENANRAAARVSAVAIPLHRSLASWLKEMPTPLEELERREKEGASWTDIDAEGTREAWLYWTERSAKSHIGKAEQRVEALNAEAPFADERVRSKVIRATAGFYGAFDHLNQVMAMPWADNTLTVHPPDRSHRTHVACGHEELRKCCTELNGLIAKDFKKAATEQPGA